MISLVLFPVLDYHLFLEIAFFEIVEIFFLQDLTVEMISSVNALFIFFFLILPFLIFCLLYAGKKLYCFCFPLLTFTNLKPLKSFSIVIITLIPLIL